MILSDRLGLDPVFPLPQVAALALLLAAAAIWLYRAGPSLDRRGRQGVLTAIRGVVILLIALVLLNPVRIRAERETGRPPLLVLVDTSRSMAVPDVNGEARFDAVKQSLLSDNPLVQALHQQFNPVFYSLADGTTRQDFSAFSRTAVPDGPRTLLGEGLADALAVVPDAGSGGVLLVSDGRTNGELSAVEVARQAKARGFPVFTVCVGRSDRGRDASIVNRRPQVIGAPEQEIPLTAEVRSVGFQGTRAEVLLLREGLPVATESVTLVDGAGVSVSFPVREPQQGTYRYTMALRPLPGEATDSNNRSSVFLQVVDTRTRVLVLEGRPTWDAKFLIQALHTDPGIELDAIYKLTDDKYFAVQGAADPDALPTKTVKLPRTGEELAKYDVIIIGKGFEDFFGKDEVEALKQYVADHAGNLIFLRGRAEERAGHLQALEPVTWSRDQIRDFRLQVTDDGLSHPAFSFRASQDTATVVQKLPTMISATRIEGEKALAVVLARAEGAVLDGSREMAVLAYQNFGQGKVVSLVGHGLWRWAFLPPDLKEFAGCYNDFWTQLVRWLVSQSDFLPGQEVTLKPHRPSYSPDDTVQLLAFVRGDKNRTLPPVRVVGPEGEETEVALAPASGAEADYVAAFKPRAAGEHVASLSLSSKPSGTVMAPFSVFHAREEDLITAADPELMRQVAAAGGGQALALEELSALPQKLRDARSLLLTRTDPRPLWDRWWVLAAILLLLSTEWLFRRRWGLL